MGRLDLSVSRLVAFAVGVEGVSGGTGVAETIKTHKLPLKNKQGEHDQFGTGNMLFNKGVDFWRGYLWSISVPWHFNVLRCRLDMREGGFCLVANRRVCTPYAQPSLSEVPSPACPSPPTRGG